MIIGIGADLVDIRRIAALCEKHGEHFLKKTFTPEEILSADRYASADLRAAHFAKRFAAKEAFAKAVGTGLGEHVHFLDIFITRHASGKPILSVSGKTKAYLEKTYPNLNIKIDLTLSDEYPMAQAFVLLSILSN